MNKAFTNGVISSAFDRLLTDVHYQNFLNLSKNDFLELLKVHQYGITFSSNFEEIMLEEELKHKQFLLTLMDSKDIFFDVLYLKFNHLFLSNLLKSHHLGMNYQNFTKNLSTYKEESLIEYVINENDKLIDLKDKSFIDTLVLITKGLDSQNISDTVMLYLHEELLIRLKYSDKYIRNYYEVFIMVENILFMIRAIKYKFDYQYTSKNILNNSIIEKHILLSFYDKSLEVFVKYLELHLPKEMLKVLLDLDSQTYFKNVSEVVNSRLSQLISDFSFINQGYALPIYFTVKKREEIIKLKQLFYGVYNT